MSLKHLDADDGVFASQQPTLTQKGCFIFIYHNTILSNASSCLSLQHFNHLNNHCWGDILQPYLHSLPLVLIQSLVALIEVLIVDALETYSCDDILSRDHFAVTRCIDCVVESQQIQFYLDDSV